MADTGMSSCRGGGDNKWRNTVCKKLPNGNQNPYTDDGSYHVTCHVRFWFSWKRQVVRLLAPGPPVWSGMD